MKILDVPSGKHVTRAAQGGYAATIRRDRIFQAQSLISDLKPTQDEVLRRIGRNLLLFQQIEHLLKFLLSTYKSGGTAETFDANLQAQAAVQPLAAVNGSFTTNSGYARFRTPQSFVQIASFRLEYHSGVPLGFSANKCAHAAGRHVE